MTKNIFVWQNVKLPFFVVTSAKEPVVIVTVENSISHAKQPVETLWFVVINAIKFVVMVAHRV